MGKNKGPNLGRALVRNRFGAKSGKKFVGDGSMLHTTEIQDGYDWGRLNLQSVTEESSFQEFIATAELTGQEFQAEKLNSSVVNFIGNSVGLLTAAEKKKTKKLHDERRNALKIPRRPKWTPTTTREELDRNEKEHFLEWRRSLAMLQEEEGLMLTPYEKNLEFWRQLWRVVERSDVVIQIVDARNPLLFRCKDLEDYVKEVSSEKINMILINKADFLTDAQRQHWADYFTGIGVKVIFYSATQPGPEEQVESDGERTESEEEEEEEEKLDKEGKLEAIKESIETLEEEVENASKKLSNVLISLGGEKDSEHRNSSEILTQLQLIDLFRHMHKGAKVTPGTTTIGLVGYPNVGKSSTINSLFSAKKVSVSATPGKTKHFQTLFLDKDVLLCDCPGLVMPSFVFTKADMVINGILPIDHMRDHVSPVTLVAKLIPRHVLEDKYGIMLPEVDGEDRSPTSEELLNTYGYNRGFMTANGQPDNPRAARYILKDFMNGQLLYCNAPPGIKQEDFHFWPDRKKVPSSSKTLTPGAERVNRPYQRTTADIDKEMAAARSMTCHKKGEPSMATNKNCEIVGNELKPWKMRLKKNRDDTVKHPKKKEKLRRLYADLDKH